jgi:DNA polymerase III sliding clamp (beta) subunit (PCNA family)
MNLKIPATTLQQILTALKPFKATRVSQPILGNVCIINNTFTATDLDTSLQIELKSGQSSLYNTYDIALLEKLTKTQAGSLVLEVKPPEGKPYYAIIQGKSKAIVRTLPADEYPMGTPLGSLETKANLNKLLRCAKFAAKCNDKNILEMIHIKKGTTHAVSTDGSRLHLEKSALAEPLQGGNSLNIPAYAVTMFYKSLRALKVDADVVTIHYSQDAKGGRVHLVVDTNTYKVTFGARLAEGQYPRYEQLIPPSPQYSQTYLSNELLNVLKQVEPMCNARTEIVRLLFDEGLLIAFAETPDIGSLESEAIKALQGQEYPDKNTAFNITFMKDMLALTQSTVTMSTNNRSAPHLFTEEGNDFIHLLMPVWCK